MSVRFRRILCVILTFLLITTLFPGCFVSSASAKTVNEFKDVTSRPEKAYYYDAVYWAVDQGITGGVKDPETGLFDTFHPQAVCTRAQMVAFLWRMVGCPEPVGNPSGFPDVGSGEYYYKAVLWGKQTGIVGGYPDGTFQPQNECTRGQAVTFLWRLYGCPEPENTVSSFSDNKNPNQYYYKAVLWATEKNITGGYSNGTFRPGNVCTRGQMVSFLYRCRDQYFYHITPMLSPFNEYFFIYTNNPDPDTFSFADESSRYDTSGGGTISPVNTRYEDVVYENAAKLRVKGGYIAAGSNTDGGKVRLIERVVTGTIPVYNLSTGETTYEKNYRDMPSTAQVTVYPVIDETDYLINTYGKGKSGYFNKLDAIQNGFYSICLYSGVYVLGEMYKSTISPYWGLSTSPHVDQNIYIQDPYGRRNNKSMLISVLYPFRYDSIGYPSMMSSVAKRLDSSATVAWNSGVHYMVDVTYKGTTKSYGGSGNGGGQGILASQIKYRFRFDRSSGDAANAINLSALKNRINEYGKLTIPDEREDIMTFADVRNKVGEGSYVRLVLFTSIFGGSNIGYTYLYDNGSTYSGWGTQAYEALGYMSNAWYDGRYFNKYEYFYPGVTLEQTMEDAKPSLVFKDQVIKFPSDGKTYYYNYTKIDSLSNYNPSTGVWKGYTTFRYDESKNAWVADILSGAMYYDSSKGFCAVTNSAFIDACTITMEEARTMGIDRNTNKDPGKFLIYDMGSKPGTAGSN